jgi:hypothetical protein
MFEVAILEITIRIFKFLWEILPIQPTIQTREIPCPMEPTKPIFGKCSHLLEKGGVLMLLKKTPSFINKPTVALQP